MRRKGDPNQYRNARTVGKFDDVDEGTSAEVKSFYGGLHMFLSLYAWVILFIGGCSIAYVVVLTADVPFGKWMRVFVKITHICELFFHWTYSICTVVDFTYPMFLMALRWKNKAHIATMLVSASLQLVSIVLSVFCIPTSISVEQASKEYGDWYASSFAEDNAAGIYKGTFRALMIAKSIIFAITSPIVACVLMFSIGSVLDLILDSF